VKPKPKKSKAKKPDFCSFDAPSNSRGLKYWSCPYDAPLCGKDGLIKMSDDNKEGMIYPVGYMDRAKICRYKLTIDPSLGDRWDSFTLKVDMANSASVLVTAARRINDCDFKEYVMEEGAE